jgi:DNA polymerase III subunit delta
MKIASRQVSAFFTSQAKDCKAVLIYGPDEGQVREHAATLANRLKIDTRDPFSYSEIGEDRLKSEPTLLYDELFAFNMLGGARLIRLQTSSDAVARDIETIFNDTQKVPTGYLLVVAGELTARSALRGVFEAHPQLAAVACYKDEIRDVGALVSQALAKAGIAVSQEVKDYLAANLGIDRHITRNELEKTILFCGDQKHLSLEQAIALVGNSADTGLDDLCESIGDGHIRRTDGLLQKLLQETVQPIQILRALQRYFLRLHLLAGQIMQDRILVSQAVANAKPKIFYKQVAVLERQLGIWKLPMLEKSLVLLTAAERACKSTGNIPEAQLRHYITDILALFHKARKAG